MLPLYDKKRIRESIPYGTIFLVFLNTIVFFISYSYSDFAFSFFSFSLNNLFEGMFFTIFTSMFMHGSIWHLLINMWFLWVFGYNLEMKLKTFPFLLYYLTCGIAGALLFALSSSNSALIMGASGAISGLLGGYLVLFPRNRIKALFPPIFLPAVIYIFLWFLCQIFSVGQIDSTVAYWGHIGGFIAGILFIKVFKKI